MTRTLLARLALSAGIALAAAGLIARPALSASLKADVTVTGSVVTLGDLFDGAGSASDRPVFRAPDPGVEGALPSDQALAAAEAAGLTVDPTTLRSVRVVRLSHLVDAVSIAEVITPLLAERMDANPADLEIRFDAEPAVIHADAASAEPIVVASVGLTPGTGRFTVRATVDVGGAVQDLALTGLATATVAVPVLARPLGRRDVVTAADVSTRRIDRRRLPAGALLDAENIAGMATRRALRAGEPLLPADLEPPRIVARGEIVTLTFETRNMLLSARGRALADGALGETVAVLNEQSRRTIEGVVVAPGKIRVQPSAVLIAAGAQSRSVQ